MATIGFINTSRSSCSPRGWPRLMAVTQTGRTTVAQRWPVGAVGLLKTRNITRPPTVVLKPGKRADAPLLGGDLPRHGHSCPTSYRILRITLPHGQDAFILSARIPYGSGPGYEGYLPSCAPLRIGEMVSPSALEGG
jgi:hypothetical protein